MLQNFKGWQKYNLGGSMSNKQVTTNIINLILDLTLFIGDKIEKNGKPLLMFGVGYLAAHIIAWIV